MLCLPFNHAGPKRRRMGESKGNAAFLGGLGLGVVLATAISCLMAKRYLEALVQEAKRENGLRKPSRKRSTSR